MMQSDSVLPGEGAKQPYVREMFDRIAGTYDIVNRVMTFGLDQGWRSRLIREMQLGAHAQVLDLACGTGDFLKAWSAKGAQVYGLDLSYQMLRRAEPFAPLVQAVGEALPFADASFDAVSSGFAVRNFADFAGVLAEVSRVLRPGGVLGVLEVATPKSKVVRELHGFYFGSLVPLIGGLISSDKVAYRYLPQSVSYLPSEDRFVELFEQSGFVDLKRIVVGLGAAQLLIAKRRGV
ncbi:ubiquinone/menaquinone biosynthesis methyltransferase [Ferrimicrobium acidiphilum]|jgi:demethylmenaquinone methyltransferase/2-methoxy-6-polyprenyl-1,4-benzoquinol methylase|uniref:ubiquinone/menaquinone biosynthesis methyltransferase n=2 Tax=Ferrimicrobium acidiphilum TaxID=121039 RepID=UPI0023F0BB1A|nr:ubiquinone/menaquinone biosynthesis methyltransferase [Ferrimicrobium acidiphilum]